VRESFWDRLRNIVPSRYDDPDVRLFKILIYIFIGAVFLMIIAGLSAFFFSLRGAEETTVPDVRNMELLEGVLDLQERGLVPDVEVRYTSDPGLEGQIISQSPPAGTFVRVGKKINLVVSLGARVDRIDAYVGRNITDVRAELRAIFVNGQPTIQIGEVIYDFDESEPGTILAQDPAPGTEISSLTDVALVVSRGPDVERIAVPSFVGLQFETAVARLAQNQIPFTLVVRDAEIDEASGYVVAQAPEAGEEVEVDSFVEITMTRPASAIIPEGEVFGVFERTLPAYAVDVELSLEAWTPSGDREVIYSMLHHPGTHIAIPYVLPENSSLILYRSDEEIFWTIVRPSASDSD
jgi:beta-lactam-binding protein with PASTA domain